MAIKKLIGVLSPVGTLSGTFQQVQTLSGSIYRVVDHVDPTPYYDGPYEATPTREAQTFSTLGFRMAYDFVVNPIPQNYGLIFWDGSVMTVS